MSVESNQMKKCMMDPEKIIKNKNLDLCKTVIEYKKNRKMSVESNQNKNGLRFERIRFGLRISYYFKGKKKKKYYLSCTKS